MDPYYACAAPPPIILVVASCCCFVFMFLGISYDSWNRAVTYNMHSLKMPIWQMGDVNLTSSVW